MTSVERTIDRPDTILAHAGTGPDAQTEAMTQQMKSTTTECRYDRSSESRGLPSSPARRSGIDLPATERSEQKEHREQRKREMQTDGMCKEADDCRSDEIAAIAQCRDR